MTFNKFAKPILIAALEITGVSQTEDLFCLMFVDLTTCAKST
jgi:hypothetical protein